MNSFESIDYDYTWYENSSRGERFVNVQFKFVGSSITIKRAKRARRSLMELAFLRNQLAKHFIHWFRLGDSLDERASCAKHASKFDGCREKPNATLTWRSRTRYSYMEIERDSNFEYVFFSFCGYSLSVDKEEQWGNWKG